VVAVGRNSAKESFLPVEDRVEAIRRLYAGMAQIDVVSYGGELTADFVRSSYGSDAVILRGVRSFSDFTYEQTVAEVNRRINGVETLFLFAEPAYAHISSTVVRELLRYGKDVSEYLP
jgi:pantetheine-phosphate adenylyltransferase